MKVLTKTCARDAKRVIYQMRAFRRFGIEQYVLLEREEHYKAPEIRDEDGGTCRVYFVNDYMPEASQIASPYLRQQYVKLQAPLVFGQSFIEVDSDMCPRDPFLLAKAITGDGWALSRWSGDPKPRWYWDPKPPKRLVPAIAEWERTYNRLTGIAAKPVDASFMMTQLGWTIRFDVAKMLDARLQERFGSVLDALLWAESKRLKISEYQLFGQFAYTQAPHLYEWIAGRQPEWCYHYSSADPLEPWMEANLKRAAGEW